LIELYEATFEVKYLQTALDLNRDLIKHSWDTTNGGFYFTADDYEALLVRRERSAIMRFRRATQLAMLNLLRLNRNHR